MDGREGMGGRGREGGERGKGGRSRGPSISRELDTQKGRGQCVHAAAAAPPPPPAARCSRFSSWLGGAHAAAVVLDMCTSTTTRWQQHRVSTHHSGTNRRHSPAKVLQQDQSSIDLRSEWEAAQWAVGRRNRPRLATVAAATRLAEVAAAIALVAAAAAKAGDNVW